MFWITFVDYPENIRVRLRSRFMAINELGKKYRGGGHLQAAGATIYNKKEMKRLLKDADDLIKEFNGVLFEFYNLTLNVSKVEKGIYLDINTFEDLARLANVLKNNVTVSQYEYSIEDKIYPFIKKLYLLYI